MRKTRIFLFAILSLFFLSACKRTMNDVIQKEENFLGIVEKLYPESILVRVSEGEEELQSSDLMVVSLDVEVVDSITEFNLGDEVRVYYDGNIAESYPAQVNKVYAVTLENSEESME